MQLNITHQTTILAKSILLPPVSFSVQKRADGAAGSVPKAFFAQLAVFGHLHRATARWPYLARQRAGRGTCADQISVRVTDFVNARICGWGKEVASFN